jgi:hypothetical protein
VRSGKSGQEMGNRQKSGGDGAATASGGKDMMAQAQDQAGTMVEQARQQATTQLSSQKERAASTLGTLGSALHEASRQVREQDDAMMAGYIDSAASQVDRLADTLKQRDLGQILDSTGRFARQQPAVFLAAAVAIGFAGARFLRSSSQHSSQGMESSGYGSFRGQSGSYASDFGSGYPATGVDRGSGYGASRSGMGRESGLEYGSSMSGSGSTLSGSDSALSGSAAADFAGTAGSESGIGRDWQARSSFDAGPEGR